MTEPSEALAHLADQAEAGLEARRQAILEMPAGSALDVLVHTSLFPHLQEGPDFGVVIGKDGQVWTANVPRYSTDAGAAFLIVAEFAKRHIPVSLYSMSHGVYFCFFGRTPSLDLQAPLSLTHEARANTPAEAIAKAALLALLESTP